ncbi:hypothetical protein [Zhenhengia yiwuensis]|uniref:Uncharacterized protein n=1 Tax=Zhenhengia yiwuensis TaxID=2763666 RepID=A0A926EK53_9FIRM|nr:hypothetical protein [Zhenhengia yiwuensis]MBC8581713.1 hypothetical protein [Zhenhengia yiwuensis]
MIRFSDNSSSNKQYKGIIGETYYRKESKSKTDKFKIGSNYIKDTLNKTTKVNNSIETKFCI